MKIANFHRRTFLGTIAGVGITAGLLPFLPRGARAAGDGPRRILLVYSPLGNFAESWWPTGSEFEWELGSSLAGLAPYKEHLLFPDGLVKQGMQWDANGGPGNEHGKGISMVWTGSRNQESEWNNGTSIDQTVAAAIGDQSLYRSIELGVLAGDAWGGGRMIYAGPGQPLEPEQDPRAAFDRLFGDFTDDPVEQAKLAQARARRLSVIDMVKSDLDRVMLKIGASQRAALESHLAAIRGIEKRVDAVMGGCSAPTSFEAIEGPNWSEHGQPLFERQADLISAAFACDLTRVASLQLGHSNGDDVLGFNHHALTHACADTPDDTSVHDKLRQIDTWFGDRMAYLLGRLAAAPEGEGSVLDNTLVVWSTDTQNRIGSTHEHLRFPYLLMGGRNFAFPTGRYVRWQQPTPDSPDWNDVAKWQHHQRLLVSISRAFGVEAETYGDMDTGAGPLVDL